MSVRNIHDLVQLVPWQESWGMHYHIEKQGIIGALLADELYVEVFHVGSTSVKGMVAKPIIDILVCPYEHVPLENIILHLERIGYKNLGECGRPGRFFLTSGDQPGETFYLHLCYKDHQVAQDQLLFQRLERRVPAVFQGYYKLKTSLAALFPDNRLMYRELKGTFIDGVLSAYRAGQNPGGGGKEDASS